MNVIFLIHQWVFLTGVFCLVIFYTLSSGLVDRVSYSRVNHLLFLSQFN